MPLDESDLVEPLEEALARKRIDVESVGETLSAHHLRLEVDGDLGGWVLRCEVEQMPHLTIRQRHRQQTGLEAVGVEDVRERWRDDRTKAGVSDRPRCMLARRAAAEVRACHQD